MYRESLHGLPTLPVGQTTPRVEANRATGPDAAAIRTDAHLLDAGHVFPLRSFCAHRHSRESTWLEFRNIFVVLRRARRDNQVGTLQATVAKGGDLRHLRICKIPLHLRAVRTAKLVGFPPQ